jgi:hypothetical protein
LLEGLNRATQDCRRGQYSKGEHSYKILARIDPERVGGASPYARKLVDWLLGKKRTA